MADLSAREGIAQSLYDCGSKEFLEDGKRRLCDAARSATADEGRVDRAQEARALKEV